MPFILNLFSLTKGRTRGVQVVTLALLLSFCAGASSFAQSPPYTLTLSANTTNVIGGANNPIMLTLTISPALQEFDQFIVGSAGFTPCNNSISSGNPGSCSNSPIFFDQSSVSSVVLPTGSTSATLGPVYVKTVSQPVVVNLAVFLQNNLSAPPEETVTLPVNVVPPSFTLTTDPSAVPGGSLNVQLTVLPSTAPNFANGIYLLSADGALNLAALGGCPNGFGDCAAEEIFASTGTTLNVAVPVSSGATYGTTNLIAKLIGIDAYLIRSSDILIQADVTADLGPCTQCEAVAGSPINLTNGNVWIQHHDYSLPGLGGGPGLRRTWNSLWTTQNPFETAGMFGDSWQSTYEEHLQALTGSAKYWRGDGSAWTFTFNSGTSSYALTSPPDERASLVVDSTTSQATVTFLDGSRRVFNSGGYLTAVADPNGNQTNIAYDGSNRIVSVTDAASRAITFAYGNTSFPRLATSVQDAAGLIATYIYDGNAHLTSATYADGSAINYSYDANGLITGTTDVLGKVLEAHTYNGRQGISSSRANGVDSLTVSYSGGTATLSDSNGNTSQYQATRIGSRNFVSGVSGTGCGSCGGNGNQSFTYDSAGNRLTSTDALGHTTTYSYDSNADVISGSIAVGGVNVVRSYTYNSLGEVLTATDPLGHVTTNTYDSHGNLLTTTTPSPGGKTAGSKTTFAYDIKGELTQITDPLGRITKMTYTPAGLVSTITDALTNVTTYAYDARGNRTSVTDALKNQTTFQYDARNRLTKIIRPDQTIVSYVYDTRGRRTSVTDENNKTTQYAYDDADRLISVTDPNNGVTQYAYDTENNLTGITDALRHATTFAYDTQRRVTKTTFPSTRIETYAYDAASNLTSKTDRKGQIVNYTYDELGRLTRKQYPDATAVNYTYDAASRLTQMQDPTGTYSFSLDNMGRLTQSSTVYSFLPGKTFALSYSYDAASNRTGLTDPNNSPTSYTYDALNRPALIKDFNRNTFTFAYDALSRTTQLARSNRVNSNYQYDAVSNLLSVLHQNGTATLDGAVYSYDAAGNRSAKTNKLNGVASNFAYDNLYELLGVTQSGSTAESYTYDAVGNRLSSSAVPGYTYDVSNELQSAGPATYTYDANGNMLTRTNSSGTTNYAWDFENRLTSVTPPGGTSVTFKYDPQGRRIQKNGSVYIYDGANLIQESDSSGSLVARYIQGLSVDQPLAAYRGSASEFYETDGLGSISSLTTTSGTVNQSYVFDSFGNTSSTTGTFTQPFRFTGREFDGETGLYYYRARYYDPIVGRFMSEDPIGFDGGSTNFYSYVLNNPIRFKDPSGNLISVNGTKQDNIDYATARLYLIQDSVMADIFYNLQRSHTTYIIHILTGDNCNNHSIDNHIYWNPHCGLRCTGTGRQSPALALGHELDHASHPRKNLWFDFSDYDNQEERRVIEGSESHAAHTLGEGIRHDHRGESVPGLASPTTIPLPRNYI